MKKIITLLSAALLTLSLSAQKVDPHKQFLGKALVKRTSGESILLNEYYKYLPRKQKSSDELQFKNTSALKQQLDMVYSADQDKDEYSYDSKGNLIEDIYYEWYDMQWERIAKSEYTYDEKGAKTLNTDFNWDVDQWVNSMKYEYTNDSDGNRTASLTYMWNGSNWENTEAKEEFSYDDKGNLSEYILAYWMGDQYMNFEKIESSYDDRGNQDLSIEYDWDGAQWLKSNKSDFVYNDNDDLSSIVTSEWDGDGWITSEMFQNFFNNEGSVSRSEYSLWEEEQWIRYETMNYTYDSRGNLTLTDVNLFDIIIYREESVYDEQDNRTEYSFFEGSFETGQLENIWKTESDYDNSFSFEDLILPFTSDDFESNDEDMGLDLELMFKHKLIRLVNYEGDGENWIMDSEYTLVYSEQNITGIEDLNREDGIYIYPNPASDQVTFTFEAEVDRFQVEIFDIEGKMVLSQLGQNNKAISLESLSEGIYFYRLESAGTILSGKLIVKD